MGIIRDILFKNYSMADFDRDVRAWIGGWPTYAGVKVNEQTALRHITVYSCVRVRSESFGMLPLSVYRKRRSGKGRDEAYDHPLYEIIHSVPNSDMISMTWRETMNGHLDLSGNCYSLITLNKRGQVIDLYPWDWYRIEPKRNKDTGKIEYHLNDRGKTEILPAERVFHVPGLGFDGIKGYSIIRMAQEAIGIGLAISEFSARFFGQGMNVGSVFQTDNEMKGEAVDELRKQLMEKGSGLANSWMPLILHSGLKFARIPMPLSDAQFIENTKLNKVEICGLFRVPPHLVADLDRATFCLPASAEIYTYEGPKRIIDVRPGELVWSRKDDGGFVLSTVEHAWPSGTDHILRITTTNRTIRLNAKHKVLTRRAHERPLQQGETGGRNVSGRKVRIEWATEYVPAGELHVGDTIVTFNGTPDSGKWETPTRQATVGFMEFCGLYLGDGYMSNNHVTIARAKDAPYMNHYRNVICKEFTKFDGGNGRGDKSLIKRVPVHLLEGERYTRFSSVEAVDELRVLGFGGNAHEKRVPGWLFGMANEAKLAFLRGFLDADGSVDKKGRITFSSCNKELLSGIRHLCMSLSIPVTNITERVGQTRLPNGRIAPVHQYAFTCSDPCSNRYIGSYDPCYTERLVNGKPFGRKGRRYPRYGGRGFSEPGAELSRITSIAIEEKEPVYDLTVKDTHSFVSDGVVVHNSNIEHQSIEYVVFSMLPLITRFEQTMNWKLFTPAERAAGYYVKFNVDALLRGDSKARAEALAIKRQNGIINADEWRELDDENPIGGIAGAAYLVNGNMITTEAAARQQSKQTGDGSTQPQPRPPERNEGGD